MSEMETYFAASLSVITIRICPFTPFYHTLNGHSKELGTGDKNANQHYYYWSGTEEPTGTIPASGPYQRLRTRYNRLPLAERSPHSNPFKPPPPLAEHVCTASPFKEGTEHV